MHFSPIFDRVIEDIPFVKNKKNDLDLSLHQLVPIPDYSWSFLLQGILSYYWGNGYFYYTDTLIGPKIEELDHGRCKVAYEFQMPYGEVSKAIHTPFFTWKDCIFG